MRASTARIRIGLVAALSVAGLLGVAGCSGKPSDNGPTPAPTSATAPSGSASGSASAGSSASSSAGSSASSSAGSTAGSSAPSSDQPTSGSTSQTVAPKPVVTRSPKPIDGGKGDAGGGVAVRVTSIKSVTAKAVDPGEIAGPAVSFVLRVTNDSKSSLDVGNVVVNVTDSDGGPGSQMSASKPFTGSIKAGATRSASYVFTVPTNKRDPLSIEAILTGASPVVVFKGNVG